MNDSILHDSVVPTSTRVQGSYPRFLLASQSRARRELLENAGIAFTSQASDMDEDPIKRTALAAGWDVDATALALSEAKARAVTVPAGTLVLGADQILALDGRRFDKPASVAEARAHLMALRGRMHTLHTACVLLRDGAVVWRHVAHPILTMRPFSDEFLEAYLASEGDAILSCVGAYRLEGLGAQLFSGVQGEQAAILGLPMLALMQTLREQGVLMM